MSSKPNVCKTVAAKNSKNSLETYKQPLTTDSIQPISEGSPVVLVDNCSTLIEVTVKTKGRKRTSTMVSSSPTSHKAIEEKRKPSNSGESYQNWGRILREQNRPTMKQSLQQFALRSQSSKSSKHSTGSKETKKNSNVQKHQKYDYNHMNRRLDEIPVKQPTPQRKSEEQLKSVPHTVNPSTTSLASSMESVLVIDRAVQCGGIFDCSNERFGVFNPVRTLSFLMKELEDLIKDEKSSKILTDMEQVLFRIPMEPRKPSADLETIALRTKLEESTVQLEKMSKKMNTVCESLREERDSLQCQVHKQIVLLEEARQKQVESETTIKKLKQELDKVTAIVKNCERTISELKEANQNNEISQKIIVDLKANLSEQTELARQRNLEMQYLILEKDKLSVLSSYKDSLLIELRNAVKELQNHIAEQLLGLKGTYIHEENSNPQVSVVHGGIACSSPTSSLSEHSNIPTSWRDISDISLSTVEPNLYTNAELKRSLLKKDKMLPSTVDTCEDSEKKKTNNITDSKVKDSHLEFISLPGESSHTLLLLSQGGKESSQLVTRGKEDAILSTSKKSENLCQSINTDMTEVESLQHLERLNKKDMRVKSLSRIQKTLDIEKDQNFRNKDVFHGDVSKISKKVTSTDPICSNIKEQFQNMFQDIRLQSRIPVNVPSPPRNYPHPDWSDSSLPSISVTSELNIMQSNDT